MLVDQIYLVQISDDGDDVITRQVFSHPGEVLNLAPSPQDRQLLVTCSKQRGKQAKALLWKLPQRIDSQIHIEEKGRTATTKDLEQLAPFPEQKLPVSEYESSCAAICRFKLMSLILQSRLGCYG